MQIAEEEIFKAIKIYNELRSELKQINELRTKLTPPITGTESLNLIQETFLTEKKTMVEKLKTIRKQLKSRTINSKKRVMVSGSNIAFDDEIIQVIEDFDALVVGDDTCTGMRYYWNNVEVNEDPFHSLTDRYLTKIPCARMYPDAARLNFVKEICAEYKASGVINYILKFCDPFQLKKYPMKNFVQNEIGLPFLLIEREYTQGDLAQVKTRVQAFLEMI